MSAFSFASLSAALFSAASLSAASLLSSSAFFSALAIISFAALTLSAAILSSSILLNLVFSASLASNAFLCLANSANSATFLASDFLLSAFIWAIAVSSASLCPGYLSLNPGTLSSKLPKAKISVGVIVSYPAGLPASGSSGPPPYSTGLTTSAGVTVGLTTGVGVTGLLGSVKTNPSGILNMGIPFIYGTIMFLPSGCVYILNVKPPPPPIESPNVGCGLRLIVGSIPTLSSKLVFNFLTVDTSPPSAIINSRPSSSDTLKSAIPKGNASSV